MNTVTDVPHDDVGAVVQTFINTGATNVIVQRQENGNYTITGT
ncbi:MAG TPA: hypothetical protein VMU84_20550 [Thermoanaerobaculia bacterium]|nr:hypothetical protein [Thermoanaerobaculia bacterium]